MGRSSNEQIAARARFSGPAGLSHLGAGRAVAWGMAR